MLMDYSSLCNKIPTAKGAVIPAFLYTIGNEISPSATLLAMQSKPIPSTHREERLNVRTGGIAPLSTYSLAKD